jgi:hypothetical protein
MDLFAHEGEGRQIKGLLSSDWSQGCSVIARINREIKGDLNFNCHLITFNDDSILSSQAARIENQRQPSGLIKHNYVNALSLPRQRERESHRHRRGLLMALIIALNQD